jgi:hypothetical protein
MKELFEQQLLNLKEPHFHVLYWSAKAEEKGQKYNITNVFDDLKFVGCTRTKQSAVSFVDSLFVLCFIGVAGESNKKNISITKFGAKALEFLLSNNKYKIKKSLFLEGVK